MFGFKSLLKKGQEERYEKERNDGYDYAAGKLLRGRDHMDRTIESLREESAEMEWWFRSGFDKGLEEAIRDWDKMKGEKV